MITEFQTKQPKRLTYAEKVRAGMVEKKKRAPIKAKSSNDVGGSAIEVR